MSWMLPHGFWVRFRRDALCGIALGLVVCLWAQATPPAEAVDAVFDVTLTVDGEISINGTTTGTTTLGNIALLPNISLSNSVASNTQNNIQIETSDGNGYTLTLHATSSPALQHDTGGQDIDNHNNAATPGNWDTAAGFTEFGFGVFSSSDAAGDSGDDILDVFDDPPSGDNNGTNASVCLGLGANTPPTFASLGEDIGFAAAPTATAPIVIATRSSATSGPTDIDLCFYVEAHADSPDAGTYTATMVLRALVN